jgi:hypothetical protein
MSAVVPHRAVPQAYALPQAFRTSRSNHFRRNIQQLSHAQRSWPTSIGIPYGRTPQAAQHAAQPPPERAQGQRVH